MNPSELELKVSLSKRALKQFRNRPLLRQLSNGRPTTQKVQSIYFDTSDRRLFRAGISLRLRRRGKKYIQTAKSETDIHHGVSNPFEIECLIKDKYPDVSKFKNGKFRNKLAKLISNEQLFPVIKTSIWRTTRKIKVNKSGKIELAIDQGKIQVGSRKKNIQEVELELKSGHPYDLLSVAETLFDKEKISLSLRSKAAQGYEILNRDHSNSQSPLLPEKGNLPKIKRKMVGQEALVLIGKSACHQILSNYIVVLKTSDPEGAHQLRVGLRRLRTALRLVKPVKNCPELDRFKSEAKKLARFVGQLRDADVLIADILMPMEKETSRACQQSAISKALTSHREKQRKKVRKSLRSSRWTNFRLNCIFFEQFMEHLIAKSDSTIKSDKITPIARKALDKQWKSLNKWGKRINSLSVVERHEMRKDLKSQRYATEFFQPLYSPKQSRIFLKQLKRLQDIFGYLNDVALAVRISDIVNSSDPNSHELKAEVENIVRYHSAKADDAWNDAQRRWEKLRDTPKFWRR